MLSLEQLMSGLDPIRQSPPDAGTVELIVARPDRGQRTVLDSCQLDLDEGLVGDSWKARGSWRKKGDPADPDAQLTIMNARAIALIAEEKDRWPLAGDQFFVDLDLSVKNLPPGTRLALGTAVVEVSAAPHLGCRLFIERYGKDAVAFVNSPLGKELRLRGLNARIIEPGTVKTGDRIAKMRMG